MLEKEGGDFVDENIMSASGLDQRSIGQIPLNS
jgi:hypothetical protein